MIRMRVTYEIGYRDGRRDEHSNAQILSITLGAILRHAAATWPG
jgi:hypothetical protein